MFGKQMMKGFALVAGGLLIDGCDHAAEAPLGPTSAPTALLAAHGDPGSGNAVITWNANAGKAAIAACIAPVDNPLHESRLYAVMHVAIHDALNAIDRRSRPYAFAGRIQEPVHDAVQHRESERWRQGQREQQPSRRRAHRGKVAHIGRKGALTDGAWRHERAIEMDALDQRISGQHVQRPARPLHDGGIVTRADHCPPGRCTPPGNAGDERVLAQISNCRVGHESREQVLPRGESRTGIERVGYANVAHRRQAGSSRPIANRPYAGLPDTIANRR